MSSMLDGKVAIVSGAGGAIGGAVAKTLAAYGAKVIVNDLGVSLDGSGADEGPAAATVTAIKAAGGIAEANHDSVADWASAQRVVEAALDHFGKVDIVINNAGNIRSSSFATMPVEDFEEVVRVHLMGSFYLSRAAAPTMEKAGSGAFVHMTSTAGLIGAYGTSGYSAAKAGILGLSRSIAMEMRDCGVRSNCVAPHAFSRMLFVARTDDPAFMDAIERRRDSQRPEQVGEMIAFLSSDLAKDITGQILGVRGNEVYLYSQPRAVRTVHTAEGWTADALGELLPKAWRNSFTPLEDTSAVYSWEAF
ncbi:SDR family oxidoreductase [Rhizorhabdus dicambivorans]|uniref:3-hydroxyacyl-CoA dehydrogenase n=1 Tax=Rhizorhabdus dicambivorans TaxID=1850238 RepID=A0A2A4FR01_9SPHN|nr:SDR family oxidoreductase [Rhizorhabdus dicambivorans]ATE66325.1 3-hydroxyacyl-CoA dehydrogenase [Rhizorhabdus dicambivorans]PCE40142.1 3-hydroxyacyl-CoA dehydrogenase [Rhizorhabdus dicambivorans]